MADFPLNEKGLALARGRGYHVAVRLTRRPV
jgi:hypothetical protein